MRIAKIIYLGRNYRNYEIKNPTAKDILRVFKQYPQETRLYCELDNGWWGDIIPTPNGYGIVIDKDKCLDFVTDKDGTLWYVEWRTSMGGYRTVGIGPRNLCRDSVIVYEGWC